MNIYIYGSDSFKREITHVLNKDNVRFRLDEAGSIEIVESLSKLKEKIEENPDNIFLIDDAKIIKKDSFYNRIGFLKPKDGIEEEFLRENNILNDVSIESYDELSRYINKRLESMHLNDLFEEESTKKQEDTEENIDDVEQKQLESSEELLDSLENTKDDEDIFLQEKNIQEEEISEDLLDLKNLVDEKEKKDNSIDLDDELSSLLIQDEKNEEVDNNTDPFLDIDISNDEEVEKDETIEDERIEEDKDEDNEILEIINNQLLNENNLNQSSDVEIDIDSIIKNEGIIDNIKSLTNEEKIGDTQMSDEFSELDKLLESDLLKALDGDEQVIENIPSQEKKQTTSNQSITLDSSANSAEIAKLLEQLMSNKTLEITIKIKE